VRCGFAFPLAARRIFNALASRRTTRADISALSDRRCAVKLFLVLNLTRLFTHLFTGGWFAARFYGRRANTRIASRRATLHGGDGHDVRHLVSLQWPALP